MPNLPLARSRSPSIFRKLAIGTWKTSYDPKVYGTMEVRMEQALEYLAAFHEKKGKKITLNHLFAKAVSSVLKQVPEANAILRFYRVYLRKSVGVFFQVAMTGEGFEKADLTGLTIHDADGKSLAEIHDEFELKVKLARSRRDPALEPTRRRMMRVPGFALGWVLRATSFLIYSLNLDLSWAGVPRDAFGSAMVTNVGSLGLDIAYPPLLPYTRVPIVIAVGAVRDAPVVENGAVIAGKVMHVNVTFDHRFIDGVHAAQMARLLRDWLEKPFEHFDPL